MDAMALRVQMWTRLEVAAQDLPDGPPSDLFECFLQRCRVFESIPFGGGWVLFLDFDGPVCSVFAGYSAARVAGELVAVVEAAGVVVSAQVRGERRPQRDSD